MRRLHSEVFNPRAISSWSARIEDVTASLLDEIGSESSEADLVSGLAYPLPLTVFSQLLGLPAHLNSLLRTASESITFAVDPQTRSEGVATLFGSVAACVRQPQELSEGLITALLALSSGPSPQVTIAEVITWSAGLILPGHESTASLIASVLFEAISLPRGERPASEIDQARFVEKVLRVHPPFLTTTWRFAATEVRLGEYCIPPRSPVLVNIASSNSQGGDHLSFGYGPHYCLGASLARLETRIVVREFLARFPEVKLSCDNAVLWQSDITVRRIQSLLVEL
jgi:13-deoxydaunorubicin hydroxylase